MTGRFIRGLASTALLATALGSTSCGYILHPERRGNHGGEISGGTLVMDLLWLIPGVVPGVVALVVDFSSGAIYIGHGERMAVAIPPDGRIAVQLPKSGQPAQLELRLVTADQRILARTTAKVGPQLPGQTVELQVSASLRPSPDENIYLEVASADGASSRFPMTMHLTR